MIKKLLSILLLVSIALIVPAKEVDAMSYGTAEYSIYNAYSTYYFVIATFEVPYNTSEMQYLLPYSDYHEFTYGGLEASIRFFDIDNDPIRDNIYAISSSRENIEGIYTWDLIDLNALGVHHIEFWIPQNFSSVPPDYATAGGFLDQRDLVIYLPVAPYDIPVYWNNVNIYSTFYAIEAYIDIPFNASSMQLYIPESSFHRFTYGATNSTITFFDELDNVLETINMIDLADSPDGLMLVDFTSYDINEVAKVKIRIMQTYSSMPSGYTDYMTEFTSVTFNQDVKLVIYIVDNEEYDRKLFTTTPTELTVTKAGYTFDGWFFKTGVKYDFASPITETYLEFNSTVILYARFSRTEPLPQFEEGTPANAFNNFLAIFHLNNLIGYVLVFVVSNIVVVIGFKMLNLSAVIMSLGMFAVTGIYIFVGIMPTLLVIIGLAVDLVIFIAGLSGGD